MLRNFFTTAGRNILKYKAYSAINFIGLTCGLTLALLIITYVRSELSYDRFHDKADRLFRLSYTAPNGLELASTPPPIAPRLTEYFPEVEAAGRLYGRNVSMSREAGKEAFEETGVFFADSALMKMFSFTFVKGSAANALKEKFTIVINEEMAKKYFGDADPIGQTLIASGKHSFKVTGVVKNFPENSHIRFNMLLPYDNMFDLESDASAAVLRANLDINFIISHSYTYVMLKPGADPKNIDTGMGEFLKKYAQPQLLVGQVFTLMPVTDIHLKSTLLAEPSNTNTMTNLYIFIGVGFLTLLIASINYINLSTAQSLTRVKEIGIRKILGSLRSQLIVQFLSESLMFCLIATLLASGMFYVVLPLLNELTGKHLIFSEILDSKLIIAGVVLVLLITAMAGGYPAYFVTRFNSVSALKGRSQGHGGQFFRRVLVVFQLTIACMLLSGSLIITKQLNFLRDRPLGFQKEHVITVPLFSQNLNGIFRQNDSTYRERLQTFRESIISQAGVKATTLSSNAPGLGVIFRGTIPEGFTTEDNMFIANVSVDYDFLNTYEMALVAGRTFSKEYGTDATEGFIVNETAVREFNWGTPDAAIGKTINREGKIGKVVGVMKDYNFTDLSTAVSPMVMEISPNQFSVLSIRFENENVASTVSRIEQDWNKMFPEKTFEFTFLDEQINQQYTNDRNFGAIIQTFTSIAMLISCLGVYGLVLFIVQRKVKEIGVRKVLGATVGSILRLIYKDFTWLLIIGFVLAVPISYYFLVQWLENFTYHTSIDVFTYLASFSLIVIVVALTISYQALKASLADPVKSLRSE